jgi:hypothetical protein
MSRRPTTASPMKSPKKLAGGARGGVTSNDLEQMLSD